MQSKIHPEELYLIELANKATLNDSILLAFAITVVLFIYFYGTRDQ